LEEEARLMTWGIGRESSEELMDRRINKSLTGDDEEERRHQIGMIFRAIESQPLLFIQDLMLIAVPRR
jgi:hypothetical protein